MEMNTRLQVEHPVTEEITGQDLVEWQLRVASGEPLPRTQGELSINGHAIEARLYAEDPAKGFLPSVGKLDFLILNDRGARIETGVEEGDVVSPFYDPMIAKIITHTGTREEARLDLQLALDRSFVGPIKTNKGFLYECLDDADFATEVLDTGLIARRADKLIPAAKPTQKAADVAASRFRYDFLDWESVSVVSPEAALRGGLFGFRLNARPRETMTLWTHGHEIVGESTSEELLPSSSRPGVVLVTERGQDHLFTLLPPRGTSATHGLHDGEIEAPMPGRVTAVEVSQGEKVASGQRLLTLEAMKMEHALTAPFDGTVAELNATPGAQVTEGQLLVKVEPSGSPAKAGAQDSA
jgi:3-methylcrotonyl-CoA carboxylase alpha subunit